ncbi:PAS domain S-box protein [Candidatus Nitrospira bockiana]
MTSITRWLAGLLKATPRLPPPPSQSTPSVEPASFTLQRHGAVRHLHELDGWAELAAHLCHTEIAVIAVRDGERHALRARIGLNEEQVTHAGAFCEYTFDQNNMAIIADVSAHPRFMDHPLVTADPAIRFFMGVPLAARGRTLAALCVMGRSPRVPPPETQQVCRTLARQILACLEIDEDRAFLERSLAEHQREAARQRKNEESLRLLIESALDGIVLADASGKILVWNKGAERLFGYTSDEVLGKCLTLLMPERYRHAHTQGIARLAASGEPTLIGRTIELHGVRKSGAEFPLELSLAMWVADGRPVFTGIIRDITERKRTEEERTRLVHELQQALEKIKILTGLVPICATCKRIRDDQGYWSQIDTYLQEHSEVEFTHGICPECARAVHPDWDQEPLT